MVRVEVATRLDPVSKQPTGVVTRCRDVESEQEWPGELLDKVQVFADPHRVAGGPGGFAGPESTPGPTPETTEVRGPEDWRQEFARQMIDARRLSPALGVMLGAPACRALREVLDAGRSVRLEISADPGDRAGGVPWEFLSTSEEDQPLALRTGCSVVRRVGGRSLLTQAAGRPAVLESAVVDLAAVHDQRFEQVRKTLKELGRGNASALHDLARVNVLHVLGHGTEPESRSLGQAPRLGRARPEDLIGCLAEVGWPELIVLIACRSAEPGTTSLSFAAQLATAGAPAVVGMLGDVETIGVAPSFLNGLWQGLGQGASLETAVQAGRVAVTTHGSSPLGGWQWGLPVLTTSTDALMPAAAVLEPEIAGLDTLATNWTKVSLHISNSQVGDVTMVRGDPATASLGGLVDVIGTIRDSVVGSVTGVDLTTRSNSAAEE